MRNDDTTKRPLPDDSKVAAALSDEYQRRILSACIRKAKSVRDVEAETGLPQATVYRNVKQMLDEGLLMTERSAITPDGKRYELYRSRIHHARVEVDADGVRIAWEPFEAAEERFARMWSSLRGS